MVEDDWRETGKPRPPAALMYRDEPNGFQLYDMRATDALDGYLQTRALKKAMDLPADADEQRTAPASSRSTCCTGPMRWPPPTIAST